MSPLRRCPKRVGVLQAIKQHALPIKAGRAAILEQDTGVEPAFTAWEAVVLPMYESCVQVHYSRAAGKKQPFFVGKGNPG